MSFKERALKVMNLQKTTNIFRRKSSRKKNATLEIPEVVLNDENSKFCKEDIEKSRLSKKLFEILLNNIMYGYETVYQKENFSNFYSKIHELVVENRILKFLLPAFPTKSSNKDSKVLGNNVDFAESICIDSLLKLARKIEAVYPPGVKIIIMSDYHTFDQYIHVEEESYKIYHNGLKMMIRDKGANDVIEIIDLSDFEEFGNVPERKISSTLGEKYGGDAFRESFSEELKVSPLLNRKYVQQKKFFKTDLSYILKKSTNSKQKTMLKEISKGMIAQGVALDKFLNEQTAIKHYIRLSIHPHHPENGKFAIDMFKSKCGIYGDAKLRTPWHNTVIFDSHSGHFYVKFKENAKEDKSQNQINVLVQFQERPYFYITLHLSTKIQKEKLDLKLTMIKHACGLVVELTQPSECGTDVFTSETVKMLVKEFGVVIFRGFKEFQKEDEFLNYYENHMEQKCLKWAFGPIHKVMPAKEMPGYVNSYEGIPVHWDMVAPPKYMGVNQIAHRYEDFTCPIFALYCRNTNRSSNCEKDEGKTETKQEGATTFIDTAAAVQSLHGRTISEWKNVYLEYETELAKIDDNGNRVYFGGRDNAYTYPLIHDSPDTSGREVLRWWQNWPKEEHPSAKQHNQHNVVSAPAAIDDITSEELEAEIRKVAFDDRFFFSHQYEKGDLVYVNNLTMLHGRFGFMHSERELWRIQSLPDSKNLPKYFTS